MPHYLFAIPLILAFSLCYAATRGEHLRDILPRAAQWTLGLCLTGAAFFLLLYYITPR